MPIRTMNQTMSDLGGIVDNIDQCTREANKLYRSYPPAVLIEHSPRAQATCIYDHMAAAVDRRFDDDRDVDTIEIRGLRLWLFKKPNVVLRLKKMDEEGRTSRFLTKQARDFDTGNELPGLPMPPVRLIAGYLLDSTGTNFVRTQIARPIGQRIKWCAAVVPHEVREAGEPAWIDITQQTSFA